MLKEFFEAIVHLGQQAKAPVKLDPVNRDQSLYSLNGVLLRIDRKQYLDVRTNSLSSFLEVVQNELSSSPDAATFVDVSTLQAPRLVGVANVAAHEGAVVMPLVFTKPFLVALAHRSTQRLTQAQLVRLLKVDLIDFVDPTVVELYRRVNVQSQGQMQAEVKTGAVRGMQSFSQEAQSPPPETVSIATPVFQNAGERDHKTIRFSIELDVSTNPPTFQVQIAGDDIDVAIRQASEEIRASLGKVAKIPAYIGSHPLSVTQ